MIKYDPNEEQPKPKDIEVEFDNWSAACAYTESLRHAGYRVIRKGLIVTIKGSWEED